ncbi:hypothetical protein DFP72DRAFT_882024 [Ephemerocybe angulata]|uniref:Endopeptidase S2P n=1 Tax=Ephemerocybe angulata TaxID=980116 RepID=A0A8H6MCS2_9AGAR|nr:hypothetical protein DFP72DRAFT_882024 [Tulosesus angulatus]
MSFTNLLLSVALIWAALYALRAAYLRRTHHGSTTTNSYLPLHPLASGNRTTSSHTLPGKFSDFLSKSQLTLSGLRLVVSTHAWNEAHDRLSGYLLRRRNRRLLNALKVVYNLGVLTAACGMVLACGGVLWVLWGFVSRAVASDARTGGRLYRRFMPAEEALVEVREEAKEGFGVKLIIPGVTVPLSDLPFIIISVFASQAFHEFGHALAASLDAIPMLSCGASLTVLIPTAFVSLSTSLYRGLSALPKARIVSAGAFHNLLMWGVLVFLRTAGIASLATALFYQDVRSEGRLVVSVDQASPLAAFLRPGVTLVKQLDDTELSTKDDNVWTNYLDSRPAINPSRGWCIPKAQLKGTDCCKDDTHATNSTSSEKCFYEFAFPSILFADTRIGAGCTDPVPVLSDASARRCYVASSHCHPDEACLAPDVSGLLRLTVQTEEESKVLLWNGPRAEVKEQVRVGRWRPRLGAFPTLGMLEAHTRLWSYLEMASLSLYFLNLLPLPYLDGMELVRCLMQSRGVRDVEGQGV